jgi:hypothetical protein
MGEKRRFGQSVSVSKCISQSLMPLSKKQDFITACLFLDWEDAVGEALFKITKPIKIQWSLKQNEPGTLCLLVQSGAAQIIHYQNFLILDRVNQYFGRFAVNKIVIKQGYIPKVNAPNQKKPLPENILSEVPLADIENDNLTNALEKLGRWIA